MLGLCVLALATGASAYSAFLLAEVRSRGRCLVGARASVSIIRSLACRHSQRLPATRASTPQLHTLRDGRRVRTLRALGEEVWGRRGRRWIMALQLTDMVRPAVALLQACLAPGLGLACGLGGRLVWRRCKRLGVCRGVQTATNLTCMFAILQVGGVLIYTVVGGASLAAVASGCWRGNGAWRQASLGRWACPALAGQLRAEVVLR